MPVGSPDGAVQDAATLRRDAMQASRLADELAIARKRLAAMRGQIVQLSRFTVVERMTLALAHELSQPLAAIANYLLAGEKLVMAPSRPDLEQLAMALDGAARQTHHAGELVARLHAFIASGEGDRRVEPLAPLIEEATALMRPDIEAGDVRLSLDLDPSAPPVLVDRVQIHQVLLNLVRNAVEAMRGSTRREVSIGARSAGEWVEITVIDSGPGLAAPIRDRLFEPFATTRSDGTGLGLMISRTIVESHGGTLSCQPAAGGGCIFRFTVPTVVPAATAEDCTVYVVEDDDAVRASMLFLLDVEGFRTRGFAGADDFLQALPEGANGCIVTDVRMPGLGGELLLRALRERGVGMPVIVVSGHGDATVGPRLIAAGAFQFIEKPFQHATLMNALRAALADAAPDPDQDEILTDQPVRLAPTSRLDNDLLDALAPVEQTARPQAPAA
jgi:signal transduction histidine kinase/FixJ family two-component response regulator